MWKYGLIWGQSTIGPAPLSSLAQSVRFEPPVAKKYLQSSMLMKIKDTWSYMVIVLVYEDVLHRPWRQNLQ